MMKEVVLFIDESYSNSYASYCRICHEAEYESCRKLETPCACAGTVKYAHRECIQRWCDEKGDIICEICLQKYEPGYTAIAKQPKKIVVQDEVVTIRRSLEDPRTDEELENPNILAGAECSSAIDRFASYCKTVALVFTAVLLLRHLLEVLAGTGHYPFSPTTIIILRGCGVIIPMCVIIRTISALQNSIRQHRNIHDVLIHNDNYTEEGSDEEQAIRR
ncbi:uncharacterized protein LOC141652053 [Silene latifolia]|uniref:uncharacterized protein LOC141652053 n=1 Tax=Silene latifolia TaxID=37657 RepID=UPI003D76AE2B